MALKTDGSVVAWGANDLGQTTVPAAAQSGVTAIAAGELYTLALRTDGTVVAWGAFGNAQATVPEAARSGITAIAVGALEMLALKTDGTVVTWAPGSLGVTTLSAGSGVIAIAAGGTCGWGSCSLHAVALKGDGSVVAWGDNSFGQVAGTPPSLPDGYFYETATPVRLGGQLLSGVKAIAAGGGHSLALKTDGSVRAWGFNNHGQTDVPAAAQSGVMAIAAGLHHSVALKTDGTVVAWGDNSLGQTTVPFAVKSRVTAIAAGGNHTVVLVGGAVSLQSRPSATGLILSWPTNAVGFTLQSTFSLAPPVVWLDSTSMPAVIGTQFTVTNSTSGSAQFYRLSK